MYYEQFYEMKHTPFVRNIPSGSLYESKAMHEALSRLQYAADNQQFAVITSDPGCGKSTLLRRFNDSLPKDKYLLLYVSDSKLTPKWLYKSLLDQLGLEAGFYRGDAKKLLQKQISLINEKEHRKVICILDEAHLLEKETLEEFRFLLNSDFDSESQLALILAGQTELWDQKLRYQRYAAIRQRVDVFCVLNHLSVSETAGYVEANLHYAGCDNPVFTDKALSEVHRISGGIPRMINRVCTNSLMYSAQQQSRLIDDHTVRFVAEHEMLSMSGVKDQ